MHKPLLVPIAILLFLCSPSALVCQERWPEAQFTVLDQPANRMMADYLTALIDQQFARRDSLLGLLKTAADWDARAQAIRDSMASWTGPLPEKTPLKARITGRLERTDYVVEKVLFESRPGFQVSANLYLPKNRSWPRPAVLNVIGHSPAGKATAHVQQRSIAQARKGFVALTIDGIGQGERRINDYTAMGSLPGAIHQVIGMQAFLCGSHIFNFMVWDAIRAVDYLCSRQEVDPQRIGCTGTSGGGMMTTYILALENRIKVAVPACNPNTWSHRVHAGLSTDHEQVFYGCFRSGIDPRGDPLFAHAPKPLLIDATTDDNLNPPSGVWALSTWLYRAYAAHGAPEKFQTTMVQAPHAYNRQQRENAYAWMLRWLEGGSTDFSEGEFPLEKEEDLWCTPGGNVYLEKGSLQPHDLVKAFLDSHRPAWSAVRSPADQQRHASLVRQSIESLIPEIPSVNQLSGDLKEPRPIPGGLLTPAIIKPEEGIILPACWIEPQERLSSGPVVIFIHDRGKEALAKDDSIARSLLGRGFRILAVDLRGTGETAPGMEGNFWDFLAGRPLWAQKIADIRAITRRLHESDVGAESVYIWASGTGAIWAALAAALEPGVSGLVLENVLLSFENAVQVKLPAYNNQIIIPGVLKVVDLPQVYQALAPRRLTVINPLLADKSPASGKEAALTFRQVAETYRALNIKGNWSVLAGVSGQERAKAILSGLPGS